jgi:hypothetical protein
VEAAMLILKFFALLGAAMAIYVASALQNGPDTTDANLCKLLRRFSSSVPDQCIPSVDTYGTAIAIFFVLVCVLILLWDFRKHVLISVKFWGAVKGLWAKVEPSHIIILGLVIAAVGLGWQLYQGKQPAPTLSQVEIDRITAPFQRQINELKVQVGRPFFNSSPSNPLTQKAYNERDIRELLDSLDEASDLIEKHILPTAAATNGMTANWFGAIPNAGAKQFVENIRKMKAAQKTEIWEPINKLVYDPANRHQEEMRIAFVLDNEAAKGELARALQVAIDAVEKLPENPSETTRELIRPQFVEADRQAVIVWNWASKVKRRILAMEAALKTKGVIELEN